jgi:hypothetical protein
VYVKVKVKKKKFHPAESAAATGGLLWALTVFSAGSWRRMAPTTGCCRWTRPPRPSSSGDEARCRCGCGCIDPLALALMLALELSERVRSADPSLCRRRRQQYPAQR